MQGGAQSGGQGDGFKNWAAVSPGQLKNEIEAAFRDSAPGDYYALILRCANPISGYKVVKVPAP